MKIKLYNPFKYLKKYEWGLWICSMIVITISSVIAGADGLLNTIASLIGVTALIFVAKGDAFGQLLTIIFSVFYGIISLKFKYYGEMITYLGMSAPAALATLIAWIKHPYQDSHEVKIAKLTKSKLFLAVTLSILITIAFYFILKALGTANLMISTVSVLTSSLACIFLIMRSPLYAAAYSANDVVLIVLWILAAVENIKYLPMILCFVMFLANDLYGLYNWLRMKKRQK